ncbi:MAG: enoyl-CoA hydratase/isomerase family protein [Mycobacterium sp.]
MRVVTLNRPDQLNAIDVELREALVDAIEAAVADPGVRAVVITGAGSAFCSGGDISSMERMPPERAIELIRPAQRVIRAIWSTGKPVLAAVEGAAIGGGTALAAACDRVIAARNARFGTPFTAVGLAADMGCSVSLPARVGPGRAKQMLMLPAPIGALAALEMGLVDALVEPGTALDAALADAERFAAGPAQAYAAIKALLAAAPTLSPLEVLDREAEDQARLFDTGDFAARIALLRARRRPESSGSEAPPG